MSPEKTRRRVIQVELSVTCDGRRGGFSEPAGGQSSLMVRLDESLWANQVPVEPLGISATIPVGQSMLPTESQQAEEVLSGGDRHTAASNLFSHCRDLKAHSRFVFKVDVHHFILYGVRFHRACSPLQLHCCVSEASP